MIECPICNKKLHRISTNGHLRIHNINLEEFKILYSNSPTHSKEYCNKLSSSQIGKVVKESTRKLISEKNNGNPAWNKGLTKENNKLIKRMGENTSKTRLKLFASGEMVHNSLGTKRSEEAKLKMRLSRIDNLIKNGNKWPSYNKRSIAYLHKMDQLNNTNGMYATNPYEYRIENLGYWVDYINFDKKVIIEIDELHHFDLDGNLLERDIKRQNNIQEYYKDFKFIRIKDDELEKLLSLIL